MLRPIRSEKAKLILEATEFFLIFKDTKEFNFRNIAQRAHVNLALINYYFQSKDGLLAEVYTYVSEKSCMQFSSILEVSKTQNAKIRLKNIFKILFKERFKHYFLRQNLLKIQTQLRESEFDDTYFESVFLEKITYIILLSLKTNAFSKLENPKLIHSFLIGTLQQQLKEFFGNTEINYINYERQFEEFKSKNFNSLQNMLFLFLGTTP